MDIGLGTYTFPWKVSLSGSASNRSALYRALLEITAKNNLRYFQFGDNYPLHTHETSELDNIRKVADNNNIQLQVGTRGLFVQHILRYIGIACMFKTGFLRLVIDAPYYQPDEKEVIKLIRQLLPMLKGSGVVLAIENHDRFSAAELVRIIEETDPESVAVCLDTANSLGAGQGIGEILPVLLPYTVNLHIKDFIIKRVEHKMGFTVSGCPAGEGMLDIPRLLEECRQYPRCDTAILELWMDAGADDRETLSKEQDWVQKSLEYLNQYT